MKKLGLLLAAAVVMVSNGLVLFGVARNRAGGPVETIQLTQRELPKGFAEKEDTGVSLRFNWNMGFYGTDNSAWLDEAKLRSIGFDTAAALRDKKHQPLPRPAFVVLEYDGPAWEHFQQTTALRTPGIDLSMQSRLVPIDASKSAEPLLQKYSDRRKYLVVRCVVRAYVNAFDPAARKAVPDRVEGSISEILPQNIHVPPSLSSAFSASSYSVTLAYGHRFEPWVIGH